MDQLSSFRTFIPMFLIFSLTQLSDITLLRTFLGLVFPVILYPLTYIPVILSTILSTPWAYYILYMFFGRIFPTASTMIKSYILRKISFLNPMNIARSLERHLHEIDETQQQFVNEHMGIFNNPLNSMPNPFNSTPSSHETQEKIALKSIDTKIKRLTQEQIATFPNETQCPITLDIMRNPVLVDDGFTYEKDAIIEHLKRSNTSPLTRERIGHRFTPNKVVKSLIVSQLAKF